ncbi:MAG: pyridoxal phosphate-dependent aminotransferase [Gemmatimonadota bacterium]
MTFSANIGKLKPSATMAVSALAKRLAAEGRDIINLSAGEPDFDTPPFISEAAIAGIRGGGTRYTPAPGMPELRKAIAAHVSGRAGRELPWEGVVASTGAKQALFNAIFSLFGPGDEVLVLKPYWTTYPDLVLLARAEPVFVTGDEARDFKVTAADLDAVATDRTRGLVLNSPSNPSGAVYSLSELTEIAEWARDRNVWLISDEIYRTIYYGEGSGAAPGVLDIAPASIGRFVLIDGLSKSHAMTGWRLGFSYSEVEVARKFTALQSQITSNPSTPTQLAALEAYGNVDASDAAITEMGKAFRRRRDLVVSRIRELFPDVRLIEPDGAFYVYFRVDAFFDDQIRDATAWCSKLIEEAGVALVPGAAFGDDRWARMSYAASDEELLDALDRIARMVGASTG